MYEVKRAAITGLAETLGGLLEGKHLFVATAESCTGGGIAEAITSVDGSSKWFDRAFVSYSNESKRAMLSVKVTSIKKFGAVSERVVKEMALGAFKKSDAAFTVAVSGIAGPSGGTDEKPVGTVWFAWCVEGEVESAVMCFPGDRTAVRMGATTIALQGLVTRVQRWLETNEVEDEILSVGELEDVVQ